MITCEVDPGPNCTTEVEIRGACLACSSVFGHRPLIICHGRIYQEHGRINLVSNPSIYFLKGPTFHRRHTIGSCSMMPRDKEGVVDPELKVTTHS